MSSKNSIGFIKLYRCLINWDWYKNPSTFKVFIHYLLVANYSDLYSKKLKLLIKRGQLVTSVKKTAEETGLKIHNVRLAHEHLQQTGEITIQTTSKFSIITINNYEKFQESTNYLANKNATKLTTIKDNKEEENLCEKSSYDLDELMKIK